MGSINEKIEVENLVTLPLKRDEYDILYKWLTFGTRYNIFIMMVWIHKIYSSDLRAEKITGGRRCRKLHIEIGQLQI